MMKTPGEIKKGLESCFRFHTEDFHACQDCPFDICYQLYDDALSYIKQLEAELVKFKRGGMNDGE